MLLDCFNIPICDNYSNNGKRRTSTGLSLEHNRGVNSDILVMEESN